MSLLYGQRHMFEKVLDVLSHDEFVVFWIETSKCYHHLLVPVAHQERDHEVDELIVVDPFVSIGVDLAAYSLCQRLRKIEVLFSPEQTRIVLGAASDETQIYAAQVWHHHLLEEVLVLHMLIVFDLQLKLSSLAQW